MASRFPGNTIRYVSLSLVLRTQLRRLTCSSMSSSVYGSVAHFERLVEARCKSRDLSVPEALSYVDSVLGMTPPTPPSTWTLNHLLGSLSKMNQFSTVASTYSHLARLGFAVFDPDVSTLTIVIKCLCESNRVNLGFSVLGTSIKLGIMFNTQMLCTLLHGLCKRGSMVSAMELFGKMEKNKVVFGTVINGLCKSGEPRKGLKLLEEMLKRKRKKSNRYCFDMVVDGLCKAGLVDEALSLFEKMLVLRVKPDVVCYTSLIQGLAKSGRQEAAHTLFVKMLENGISPNAHTYNVLIDSLCKESKIDEALRLFDSMPVAPNIFCHNSLIAGLCKSGKWDKVNQILMKMKCQKLSPNIVTFGIILDARFKEGNIMAALSMVGAMIKKRPLPDSFLTGLGRLVRTQEADILAENIENSVDIFTDTRTLNVLLNGLLRGFMAPEARSIFESMVDQGLANGRSFNIMINGYCLQGEMEEAEELFNRMGSYGIPRCAIAYGTLANGYLKAGRVGEALEILKDSVLRGVRPDDATRRILRSIKAYKHEMELKNNEEGDSNKVNTV